MHKNEDRKKAKNAKNRKMQTKVRKAKKAKMQIKLNLGQMHRKQGMQ